MPFYSGCGNVFYELRYRTGFRIRAALVDAVGKLDSRRWEETAAEAMAHVWLTDCDSLYEHLASTQGKQVDNKRVGIDLAAMRQAIWDRREGADTMVADTTSGDYPRWIDTSVMLADPLTKVMDTARLEKALMWGVFDMRPTAESLMAKERNRKLRQRTSTTLEKGVVQPNVT